MPRITSKPTTISVQSQTTLSSEAHATASNSFRIFAGGGLSTRVAHPISGVEVDVTEDGARGAQPTYTTVDWCGKGAYDPTTKRVLWMGKGIGNRAGGWVHNTLAVYNESIDRWSATRAFRLPGVGETAYGIGHTYDNNCISITRRRLYKKQFTLDGGFGSGNFHVYNLDTNSFEGGIAAPRGDDASYGIGPADVVPTRGKGGAIWYANSTNSDTRTRLMEYDIAGAGWLEILPPGSFPALPAHMRDGGALSYNSRAFGGAGGALLLGGSTTAYTVGADTMAVTAVGAAPMTLGLPHNAHVCRDPSGTGWLMFGSDGYVYRCDSSSWTRRAALPSVLTGANFIIIPIDVYGVVWVIRERPSSGERAWLYRS